VDDGVFVEVLLEVDVAEVVAVFDELAVDVLDDVDELVEEAVEVGVCDQEGDKDGIVP
jgi:hypothetical protein